MMLEFKEISILSWNIRGASSAKAKRHINDIIRKYKPTFLFIMETHVWFDGTKKFWGRVGYRPVVILEAQGHAGGLWILMQVGFNCNVTVIDIGSHSCTFSIERSGIHWVCTGVYASPIPVQRSVLWQHLCNSSTNITSPWMIMEILMKLFLLVIKVVACSLRPKLKLSIMSWIFVVLWTCILWVVDLHGIEIAGGI